MSNKVLVIAAHPDDEVLGCGGTIARHADSGDNVFVSILAEGITSRDNIRNRDKRAGELSGLKEAATKANKILGAHHLELHDFPDNSMDSLPRLEIIKKVESLITGFKPNIIYTHHAGDLNIDHRLIHEAVVTACRPTPDNHGTNELLFFEVSSSTEWQPPGSSIPFVPNWFVDISHTIEKKIDAFKEYKSEVRSWPHARSPEAVRHLAGWRGATIGVPSAEAFVLGRKLVL